MTRRSVDEAKTFTMAIRAQTVLDLVGDTPMVRLGRLAPKGSAAVWAKLEMFNPLSSIKDRIATAMIEAAEGQGLLTAGGTVVEPTSGNTGLGLAMVCAVKGYRLILTMPDSMSVERRRLLAALGADIVLTPGAKGMPGAIARAEEIRDAQKGFYMPGQFRNPANPAVHERTTALEIIEQSGGKINAFVAGVGTGGTLTGVGKVLRKEIAGIRIVAVEPAESPVLSGGEPGPHKIQGIGAGFVPEVLDRDVIDEVRTVSHPNAVATTRRLAREEGILAGVSSGAACFAALAVASELGADADVVVILPDTGERYLSAGLFNDPDPSP
jgi:cysteine synthase A